MHAMKAASWTRKADVGILGEEQDSRPHVEE
jgi:hypothetical protein